MLNNKNPFELWLGVWPSIEHLKVFGYKAYTHVPKLLRTKLDPKSCKCFFLGYCDETKAYHLWDDIAQSLVISCDVIFDEEATPKSKHHGFLMVFNTLSTFQHIFLDFLE
jgi:hypothetical protein